MQNTKVNWKRGTITFAVLVTMGLPMKPAHALFGVGDVVFDPAAVAQAIQQVQTMRQQYEEAKRQYEAMTGNTNYSNGLKQPEIVSGSWQDVVRNQGGAFGSKQQLYDKMLSVMDGKDLARLMNNTQFKQSYENVRMGMAFSDASYGALEEHIENLNKLREQLNSTKSIKEAQDLANAIAIENAMIQTITARLSAVQTNLIADSGKDDIVSSQGYNAWLGM